MEKKIYCDLCQIKDEHRTSKCPSLVCVKCGLKGHAKRHCQTSKRSLDDDCKSSGNENSSSESAAKVLKLDEKVEKLALLLKEE